MGADVYLCADPFPDHAKIPTRTKVGIDQNLAKCDADECRHGGSLWRHDMGFRSDAISDGLFADCAALINRGGLVVLCAAPV